MISYNIRIKYKAKLEETASKIALYAKKNQSLKEEIEYFDKKLTNIKEAIN